MRAGAIALERRDTPRTVIACRDCGRPLAIQWARSVKLLTEYVEWDETYHKLILVCACGRRRRLRGEPE